MSENLEQLKIFSKAKNIVWKAVLQKIGYHYKL